MWLRRMNEALHQQEEKAPTDRRRNACLPMSSEASKEIETNRSARETGKEAKKVERQRKKEAREEVEKEWAEMKRKHAVLVDAWEKECAWVDGIGHQEEGPAFQAKAG
ncbi:hypothetical protein B0H14DRAFT_3148990 [Mycena olivaceomarginata]|nr:hypothetical protein B0H14DRAFT_3148990 [Mycena olivaceomarginata]